MRYVNWIVLIVLCVLFCLSPVVGFANDPTHTASITGFGSPNYLGGASSVYISGNYAYVSSSVNNALTVFDISDIKGGGTTITHKAAITGSGAPNYLDSASSVYVSGNYAYVASFRDDALTVFNISNIIAGGTTITHKAAITGIGAPNYLNGAFSVYVSGDYAYVASLKDNALSVFDISGGTITLDGAITGSGAPNYLHVARSVYEVDGYAYVASYSDYALTVFHVPATAHIPTVTTQAVTLTPKPQQGGTEILRISVPPIPPRTASAGTQPGFRQYMMTKQMNTWLLGLEQVHSHQILRG